MQQRSIVWKWSSSASRDSGPDLLMLTCTVAKVNGTHKQHDPVDAESVEMEQLIANVNPIRTQVDYRAALAVVSKLVDKVPTPGTPDGDGLGVLATLVDAYAAKHRPIPAPDPIEFLQHVKESRGLTRKDLKPCIGSRASVSEILNCARPLTLTMIRRLCDALNVPADVLLKEYPAKAA